MSDSFEHRLENLMLRIESAAIRANRNPAEVDLVAVTKGALAVDVATAIRAGVTHFGENRLQDAVRRLDSPEVVAAGKDRADIRWHFVGHCQTNKAVRVVERFDRIDSVDSLRLARAVGRSAVKSERDMPILIEINIAREAAKYGFAADDFEGTLEVVREVEATPGIKLEGLMTIGPIGGRPERAREAFAELAALREKLAARLPHANLGALSMGMSDDFESAIEYGSTEVRIGRALFAPQGNLSL